MARIQLRRDTAENWSTNNPTPLAGEPCFETDTGKLKIGDGSTAYNDLAYQGGGGSSDVPENMMTTDTDQTITGNKTISKTSKLIFDKISTTQSNYKPISLIKGEEYTSDFGYANLIYTNDGTTNGIGFGTIQQGSGILFPTGVSSQKTYNRIYSKGSSSPTSNLNIVSDGTSSGYVNIKGYTATLKIGPREIQLSPDLTSSSGKVTVKHTVNDSTSGSAKTYYAENTDASSIKRHITAGDGITIEKLQNSSGEDTGIKISASGSGSGSGDVTAAGNNTFTGLNTFDEPIQLKSVQNTLKVETHSEQVDSEEVDFNCPTIASSTGDIYLNPVAMLELENSSGSTVTREGRIVNGSNGEVIPSINDDEISSTKTWSSSKLSKMTPLSLASASNASMPGGNTYDFTIGSSGTEYMATTDGYIVARCRFSSAPNSLELYIKDTSGNVTIAAKTERSQTGMNELFIPIAEGATFGYKYDGTLNTSSPSHSLYLVQTLGS